MNSRRQQPGSHIEGAVYTHRVLMRTARVFLEAAEKERAGSYYNALSATLFTWLAFEAYLNSVIEHLDPKVFATERDFFTRRNGYPGPMGKLRWILEGLGAVPDRAMNRRMRAIELLQDVRNQLTHAKPVRYSRTVAARDPDSPPMFADEWVDRRVRIPKVRLYETSVSKFCEWLHPQIRPEFDDPHMRRDAFEGTTQAQTTSGGLR